MERSRGQTREQSAGGDAATIVTGEAAIDDGRRAAELFADADADADADSATAVRDAADQVDTPVDTDDPDSDAETLSADEDSGPGDETSTADRTPRGRDRGLAATVLVALVITVVSAVAAGVSWLIGTQYGHQQRDNAVAFAARDEVLALLTLSPENVQSTFDRVLADSTGGWRQEFAQQSNQFTQAVRNGQVRSDATITDSAIQTVDDNHAVVLVAANAMIRNSDSPQGYPGVYRVLMNLQKQDGRWLVSDLQFVP